MAYDTETCLNSNNEHFVNVLAFAMYCPFCIDLPLNALCNGCGDRRGLIRYTGQDTAENTVINTFVEMILHEPRFNYATLVAHNGGKFDHIFCLRSLYERGIAPKIMTVGTKIIAMRVERAERGEQINNLSFIDSYQLIPVPLASMPEAFGFDDHVKGIFPYSFNRRENWGRVFPTHPPESEYGVDSMKEGPYMAFRSFYDEFGHLPFDFDTEISRYCENDVTILIKALKSYSQTMQQLTGWNPLLQVI